MKPLLIGVVVFLAFLGDRSAIAEEAVTRGMDMVDGALICPSYDLTQWLYGQINTARHFRKSIPPELRRQAALAYGYDQGNEPKPSDYGCALVAPETQISITERIFGSIPVVSVKLANGRQFRGVTLPSMLQVPQPGTNLTIESVSPHPGQTDSNQQ